MQDGSILGNFFRNKWVRLTLAIDLAAVIFIIAVAIVNSSKNAIIEFAVTPIDATIFVNGAGGYTNGSYRFAPGKYEIMVSRDGLESKTFSLELDSNEVQVFPLFLSNGNSFGFYELKENYSSLIKLVEIASGDNNLTIDHDTSAEKFIQDFEHNSTLFDYLPIIDYTATQNGLEYGVHYQYDVFKIEDGRGEEECVKTLCLLVTDTMEEKNHSVESILENLDYNPTAFQFIYGDQNYE